MHLTCITPSTVVRPRKYGSPVRSMLLPPTALIHLCCSSYTLAYNLLFAELATFLVLIIPYPYAIRKRLFQFLSKSTIVATIGSALKISFLFVPYGHAGRLTEGILVEL